MKAVSKNLKHTLLTALVLAITKSSLFAQVVEAQDSIKTNATTMSVFDEIKHLAQTKQDSNLFTFLSIAGVLLVVGVAMYVNFRTVKE
jgi:putative exporter of polyketide antibiotics